MGKRDTIDRLLGQAEKVLAESGYHGASLRDIATAANVSLGSIHKYFQSKEQLYIAVCDRRIRLVNQERVARLEAHRKAGCLTLERILDAIVTPITRHWMDDSSENRVVVQLVRRLASSPERIFRELSRLSLDLTAVLLIDALREADPGLTREQAAFGYFFVIHSMYHSLAQRERILRLSNEPVTRESTARLLDAHLKFCAAGLKALAPTTLNTRIQGSIKEP